MILDSSGREMLAAHDSGSKYDRQIANWRPNLLSADSEWLPDRNESVSRTRDLIRNHGFASGALQSQLDNIIGQGLRLSAKPDIGTLGITEEQGQEFAKQAERVFNMWCNNSNYECDASKMLNFAGMCGLATRSLLADGEILAVAEFIRGRRYRTAINNIDPDRLSNPQGVQNSARMKSGVELGLFDNPTHYHIRTEHPGEQFVGMIRSRAEWKRIKKETRFGRPKVIHVFDKERPGQHRGKGMLNSVVKKLKMITKLSELELEQAMINSMYGFYITSDMPKESVAQAMGQLPDVDSEQNSALKDYMGQLSEYHSASDIKFDGAKMPHLFPGENIKALFGNHPSANFNSFLSFMLQEIASGANMSMEQLTKDFSRTNYSGIRASILEGYRTIINRRQIIGIRYASPVYRLVLEEAISVGDVVLPSGAPSFAEATTAWCGCRWTGPRRGQVDPLKESNADKINLNEIGCTTLEDICSERGVDYQDVISQREREKKQLAESEARIQEHKNSLGITEVALDEESEDEDAPDEDNEDEENGDDGDDQDNANQQSEAETQAMMMDIEERVEQLELLAQ